MEATKVQSGIRQNPAGDWPEIDPSSFVDPSAQIMGNVHIGPNVYVGPLSVIRADEVDSEGKVHPVIIGEGSLIQDGVIIHARAGTVVKIGPRANIAHGVIIHGPSEIQQDCFLALRVALYNSILEEGVWVGIGSIILRTTVPSHTMIPAGSVVRSNDDLRAFRITNVKEEDYRKDVFGASSILRESYRNLYGGAKS